MLDYVAPSKADDVSQSPGLQFYAALGWQRQVPCSRIMADPGHPRCLQDSFCSSLHCVFAFPSSKTGKKATKEKKKKRWGEMTFQWADQQLLQVPVLGLSQLLYAVQS
jgi:hypothetical protein